MGAIDPLGQGTYKGLGIPLYGESVVKQRSSDNTAITLMLSTANTGRFLLGMDYVDDKTLSTVDIIHAVFDIDEDGGFRSVSGTTVKFEMNTSGFFKGSTEVIDSSATMRIKRKARVSVTASTYTLVSSNAGRLHIISTADAARYSSITIKLPSSATGLGIAPGMHWDIFCNTPAAGIIDIASIGANTAAAASSARILCHHGTTDAVDTSGAITHVSSGPFWVRIMAVSTGASPQYVISNLNRQGGATTALLYYGLTAGSTALT